MEPIITYRQTETGVWSYHFYSGRKMIGKATCAFSLSSMVRIESADVFWYSTFHMDTEIFLGVSRKVMDNLSGQEAYRVIFSSPGFYRMIGGEMNLLVECRENAYLFGNPGEPVLAMTERIREWSWVPAGEPVFRTTIYEDVPEELVLAMAAFPAVRV